MRDVLPAELADKFARSFQMASESGELQLVEYDLSVNGQIRYSEARVVPTSDGKFLTVVRDITERRHAEQALRESEARFRLVTMATRDGVYDWDLRTQVVWRNEAYQRLFSPCEPIGVTDEKWWEQRIHPKDHQRVTKGLENALQSQTPFWSEEYSFRRVDDTYAMVMDRGYILFDDGGRPVRMIGAITDITERRLAEQALRERERELGRSNVQIRELAGKLMTAQEEERRRISRELHDDINQKVAALMIAVSSIKHQFPARADALSSQLDVLQRYCYSKSQTAYAGSHMNFIPLYSNMWVLGRR